MKLRIRENSLRLRLGPAEVAQLVDAGSIAEAIHFGPGQKLAYTLKTGNVERPTTSFRDSQINVIVPKETARQWANSKEVGIEATQQLPTGGQLQLLIEKDFECLDAKSQEPQEDVFPHPETGTDCRLA